MSQLPLLNTIKKKLEQRDIIITGFQSEKDYTSIHILSMLTVISIVNESVLLVFQYTEDEPVKTDILLKMPLWILPFDDNDLAESVAQLICS